MGDMDGLIKLSLTVIESFDIHEKYVSEFRFFTIVCLG